MLIILISQMIVDLQKAEKLRGQNFALFASGFPASTAPLHCTLSTSALALYPLVHRTTLYPLVHWHCIHKCIAMYCIVSTIALTLYPFVLQALLKCTSLLNSKPPLPISKEENWTVSVHIAAIIFCTILSLWIISDIGELCSWDWSIWSSSCGNQQSVYEGKGGEELLIKEIQRKSSSSSS